jgi:4-hydroxy-tetrahydrodipicolinate reductase
VLQASNFASGVCVLTHLVTEAARALPGFAVEIDETHHLHKKDSPSGTALRLRDAVRAGRGPDADAAIRSHRQGEVVGDHRVVLSGPGERLELAHHAEDRSVFARGALAAAVWLARQPAGRYSMADVLGLR